MIDCGPLRAEAKKLLSLTIRGLRERLLRDIRDEAERRYHLAVPVGRAGLDEAPRKNRERLEAWLDERVRATGTTKEKDKTAARERFLGQAVKEAGATLVNRLALIRHLEAMGLSKPEVVTGGWNSKGYQEFRDFASGLLEDDTEGYLTLLQIVFGELAVDLPGLFGDVGLTRLLPVPPATLREVVNQLDDKDLASAWTDDTTLGWIYQYWNDPERESLDAKINAGGKIEPHEIASKTQMFTERYMVEWLLQNSLGLTWLCICKKNGWTPDAERTLPVLEARRAEWRKKREAGDVALDALMPIASEEEDGGLEDAWKYHVPQPIPDDAVEKAPASIRDLKLLDPACGSGHFLVIAFGLLVCMYHEEGRHRRQSWSDEDIAESILANNLHGVDIDPRAIQLAAAGLYLKAKTLTPKARLTRVNIVAPTLQLGSLPSDDPALVQLRAELKREAGIPEELTAKLVSSLAGVDHLGTLLKVDAAVEEALRATDLEFERTGGQGDLFGGYPMQQIKLSVGRAKATVLDKLEQFLARRSSSDDLGLRLDGEQLAAGVRFVRMVRENTYDVVVGNPPYQALSKTVAPGYVARTYPKGKADLYAAFLERGTELCTNGGVAALLTMRGWMFLSRFAELREILHGTDLRLLGDVDRGAFEDVPDEVLATVMSVMRQAPPAHLPAIAIQPTPLDDRSRDSGRTDRKRAALLAHVGRFEFDPKGFDGIEGEPIVYWWSRDLLRRYAEAPKLGSRFANWQGIATTNNARFLRCWWEVAPGSMRFTPHNRPMHVEQTDWVPYVKGARGLRWIEPSAFAIRWKDSAIELSVCQEYYRERHPALQLKSHRIFFGPAVAYSTIGAEFFGRVHRFRSVFADTGCSVLTDDAASLVCQFNTTEARNVLASLNPSVHFQVGDVNRMPLLHVGSPRQVFEVVENAFAEHESHREPSVEFKYPGPSPWRYAQDWAQRAVDRPEGEPLPPYEPEHDAPEPESFVSFAVGVALGRFGSNGEGILDKAPATALPAGVLYLSAEGNDSLEHPACALLHAAWTEYGARVGEGDDLRAYLRTSYFGYHKKLYENRPIYFPLSSTKKNFVAFASIHRFTRRLGDGHVLGDGGRLGDNSLSVLLADHLVPEKRRLEGELEDIRKARIEARGKAKAEKRFAEVQKLLDELGDFIEKVTLVAEQGPPPPPNEKTDAREVDARFAMDLDDGVMVNSAALWPLLDPQWKDPRKWWKELATAKGRKDYDWAHLAARYFPERVRRKCVEDPSLAVAHRCFWQLHPAKAYAWELRLQDEIRPGFTIDEPGSDEARARFLADHATEAKEIEATEQKRRDRKAAKAEGDEAELPFEAESEVEAEDAEA